MAKYHEKASINVLLNETSGANKTLYLLFFESSCIDYNYVLM